jgi:HEAT repeat protein
MWLPPPLPRTLAACERDVGSSDPKVRVSALLDFARLARREVEARSKCIDALVRALSDDIGGVRHAAAEGLADLHAKEATTALLLCIEDEDVHVRQMGITALGEIGDDRALPRLRRALADDRPEVRFQAVVAVCRISKDEDEIADVLESGMKDRDPEVRTIAIRAAEDCLQKGALPARVRSAAADALEGGTHDVANAAAIFLVRAGDARGEARVLQIVSGGIPSSKEDEQGAIEVAGERGLAKAKPALERRAFGIGRVFRDTCAFHARIALARLGSDRAIAAIKDDLGSWSRARREAAVVAAGRAGIGSARETIASMTDVDEGLKDEALKALGT